MSEFPSLPLPARLWVPCPVGPKPPGSRVARGEALGAAGEQVPSPANGRIVGASRQMLLGGSEVETIEIETEPAEAPAIGPATSPQQARQMLDGLAHGSPETYVAKLLSAGIAADRWTSPDLTGQLAQSSRNPVDAVLGGALDLDPVLPVQQSLCKTHAIDLAAGVMALAKIAGAVRGIIALPEDSPADIVVAMKAAGAVTSARLYPLRSEYPTANPSLLIRRVLGRRLRPGLLPTQVGVLLVDAPAAVAIGRYFIHAEPLLDVPFGLFEWRHARRHTLNVPIGTRLSDLLDALSIPHSECDLRIGHVLREKRVTRDAIIAGGELTLVASEAAIPPPASACVRCGWCVDACPAHLHPAGLLEAAQQQDLGLGDRCGLQSCIECGICTYVCPSRLPLLQAIRALKAS
ncbi:MAG TPA: 4Fe-4S dicluster domain-containing protein [Tepidisphaeraceae bacterium]|nr:4Fe-4S dicluster domain-containing protein [Tepidisphaeraceae bacterium]